ncbi:MAG: hypothetical protein R3F17_15425 [Planctomycetota bacterium]
MEGVAWEQVCGATLDMLEILPPHVGLRLHLFTLDLLAGTLHVEGGLDPVPVREQRIAARRQMLRAGVPGGSTDILRSLRTLAEKRQGTERARIVLVTDGWQSGALLLDAKSVRAQLEQAGLDLSIVATGERPDWVSLKALLLPDEKIVHAEQASDLGQCLLDAGSGDSIEKGPGLMVAADGGAPDWVRAQLPGDLEVSSYLRTRARPGAQVWWRSNRGDPLLAVSALGSGRVACLPSARGLDFLSSSPGPLFGLITKLVQDGAAGRRPSPATWLVGGDLVVEVPAEVDLTRAVLRWSGDGGTGGELERRGSTDPRWDARRVARWGAARLRDVAGLRLWLAWPGGEAPDLEVPWSGAVPAEFLPGLVPWPTTPPTPAAAEPVAATAPPDWAVGALVAGLAFLLACIGWLGLSRA